MHVERIERIVYITARLKNKFRVLLLRNNENVNLFKFEQDLSFNAISEHVQVSLATPEWTYLMFKE